MNSHCARLTSLTLSLLLLTAAAQASDAWPGLRGPSYDGAVRDATLFEGEEGELTLGWKRELGSGYSVVAVDGHGGLARVRVRPAGQEGIDQLPVHVLRGQVALAENLVDPVEAVQLLRPRLERLEMLFD